MSRDEEWQVRGTNTPEFRDSNTPKARKCSLRWNGLLDPERTGSAAEEILLHGFASDVEEFGFEAGGEPDVGEVAGL
jgi:hypothetical protein